MRDGDSSEVWGNGMIRHLFTIASAISLLLCIATAALWLRSRNGKYADDVRWQHGRMYCVDSADGHLCAEVESTWTIEGPLSRNLDMGWQPTEFRFGRSLSALPTRPAGRFGFDWGTEQETYAPISYVQVQPKPDVESRRLFFIVPDWTAMITFGLMPFFWAMRKLSRRAEKSGSLR